MHIVLGSASTDKLNILKQALDGKLAVWGIEGVAVDSGISEQPLSIEEATQGAINRAKAALQLRPQAGMAVGLEAGLEDKNGIYWLVCVAAFWDEEHLTIGHSGQLPLPQTVSDKVKAGGEFGKLIREYQKTARPDEIQRINELISRKALFTSAINQALPQLKRNARNNFVGDVAALFASEQGPSYLLRLAAICIGLFFGLRAIIALASPILALMQILQPWFVFGAFYTALIILLIPGFGFLMMGLRRLSSKMSLRSEHQLTRKARFAVFAYLPFTLLWLVVISLDIASSSYSYSWIIYESWSDVLLVLIGASVASIFSTHWLLLRQLTKTTQASVSTIFYIFTGTLTLITVGWLILQQSADPYIFISPLYAIGLSWSLGWWRLARDIENLDQPEVLVDISQSIDRI